MRTVEEGWQTACAAGTLELCVSDVQNEEPCRCTTHAVSYTFSACSCHSSTVVCASRRADMVRSLHSQCTQG